MNTTENTPTEHGASTSDPLTSPMTTGQDGAAGFDAIDAGATSKIPHGAAVLVLVALVGGGAIFTMRQFGLGSGFNYDDISIDYPIDAAGTTGDDDYQDVLTDLTNHTLPHVALADLRPKPFQLDGGVEDDKQFESVAQETPEQRAARERAARDAALQREFTKLTLNSVIGGSRPIARISGKAVRPGDVISGMFHVDDIRGRVVYLSAEGRQYTLSMTGN